MHSNDGIFILGILSVLLTDAILWHQLKRYLYRKRLFIPYFLQSAFFLAALFLFQYSVSRPRGAGDYFWIEKIMGIVILFYLPKFFFILFNGIGLLFEKANRTFGRQLRRFALGLAGFLFLFLLYSLTLGRYHYKIETVEVPIKNLPAAFYGFRIVQLADLHLGSFGKSYIGIERMVQEVNRLQPDIIVFTGDMVNNFADEMRPWISVMKTLQATYGKYAVTGNHDYGDYTSWSSLEAKQDNLRQFYRNMQAMGFRMLNNTHLPLVAEKDTLWLAGVENWGNPPFPRYGRLHEALDSIPPQQAVILLSHDPSHWRAEILNTATSLTLSGHTHAMQMGIKIGKKTWSPARYLYSEYDGLYREGTQYLYVSRGQGYLGFPGRIGLRPVITELILIPDPPPASSRQAGTIFPFSSE